MPHLQIKLKTHYPDYDPFTDADKFENITLQAYPPTRSGLDRFFLGMIIGSSAKINNPNICVLQWNELYYSVVAAEAIYQEWELVKASAYTFFSRVITIYDSLEQVNKGCHVSVIAVEVRKTLMDGDYLGQALTDNLKSQVMGVI